MKCKIEKTEKAFRLINNIIDAMMTTNKRKHRKVKRGGLLLASVDVDVIEGAVEIHLGFTRNFTKGFKVNGKVHEFYRTSDHQKIVRKLCKLRIADS